jgi:hypothetical protein
MQSVLTKGGCKAVLQRQKISRKRLTISALTMDLEASKSPEGARLTADALSPAEAAVLKTLLTSDLTLDVVSPEVSALIERGHLRVEGQRVLVTVQGHVAYLKALPAQFED